MANPPQQYGLSPLAASMAACSAAAKIIYADIKLALKPNEIYGRAN